ncbi:S8 family peptidase [Shewanella zhangzhouensis]|uniref:S8 family peptidase n=1 Tax=Shewanella zhangzhouensis TaxID=2864213 RepID=UPI001C654B67|nr:S8 family peptidase [Shewanella zhangzhouensis]QYK05185.1 S8 family serine peptidase [Shewanella zhangzhouensis]
MQIKTRVSLAVAIALASAGSLAADNHKAMQGLKNGRAHVADELIVQYRADSNDSQKELALARVQANHIETLGKNQRGELRLVSLPVGKDMAAAMRELAADPNVEFVEPNWIYQHADAANDTYYTNGSLWGMYGDATNPANGWGSHAGEQWNAGNTDCSDVVVGIIDEGYMYEHEDLADNAFQNPGEIPGDGIDNDGNGYVDDVYGWDFDGNDNSVFDGTIDDHGTHVAGTIGAVGGNGKGVAGVCWNVKLMSGKFLGRRGGTTANAVKAVDYFTDMKQRHGLNLVATSNSWGGGGYSQALEDAIGRANDAGILFIAAAGNDSYNCDSGSNCYPAEYPNDNIIAVASITSSGAMSSFSSYGATTVDICAPGSGIYSTVPKSSKGQVISGYASYNGTSMATPHVSGAAALYKALHPSASHMDVKDALLNGATPTGSCQGKVSSNGRLDVSSF